MAQIRFNARHGLTVGPGSTPINIVDALGNGTFLAVTGTWQGVLVTGQYGGTGVNNTGKTITLGGNLVTSGAFATTLTVSGATNVTLPTTGTLATTGNLSQFAATSSAQLAGIITDETGSGVVVFGTSPSINTATLVGSVDASALTLTGGTILAVSKPVVDATQTWNGAGITFIGLKLNVTNTASGAQSALLDLQVGGASTFSVNPAGAVTIGTWNATTIADGKIAAALTGKTYNALSLTSLGTGFTVSGGTTAVAASFIGGAAYSISGTSATTTTLPLTSGTLALNNQTFFIGTTNITINQGTNTLTSLAGLTNVTSTTFTGSGANLTNLNADPRGTAVAMAIALG